MVQKSKPYGNKINTVFRYIFLTANRAIARKSPFSFYGNKREKYRNKNKNVFFFNFN